MHIGSIHHCGRAVKKFSFTMNAGNLNALSTALEFMPALEHNLKIGVLGVYFSKTAGAYTGGSAVSIRYNTTGTPAVASIPASQVRSSGATSGWATLAAQTGVPADFAIPEDGLEAVASSDFSGSGGDLTITVRYIEVR